MTPAAPIPTAPPAPAIDVVVVGGSAGSVEALGVLLAGLPPDWALAMAIVVHLPRDAPSALAGVLAARCALPVLEAEDKEPLAPGTVHVARPGYHLIVDPGPALALAIDEPVHFCIPAIDVLFESAAAICGPRVAGIVLSGGNADGARGLAAIRAAGGLAAVQAPEEAAVDAMPRAALEACPDARVLPLRALADLLASLPHGVRA